LVLCGLVAAACGPRVANIAGVWQGSWTSADRQSTGTFRVEIRQRGNAIGGPIELSLDWLPQARIDGVVEGQKVRWGVLREGVTLLTFEGIVAEDSAEGRYSISAGGEGTWTARRVRSGR
jgi:hypothetical protein